MLPADETPPVPAASAPERRVTDLVIKLALLGLCVYWTITLIAPFALFAVWAVILAVAFYPAYRWLSAQLGGRGWIAATLLSGLCLVVIIGPLGAMVVNLTEDAHVLVAAARIGHPPPAPAALLEIPVVGEALHRGWSQVAAHSAETLKSYRPTLLHASGLILGKAVEFGLGLLHFAISAVIMGFLFRPGPAQVEKLRRLAARLSPERGPHFVELAGATIRNVSRGVIGVSVLQALIAGMVFAFFDFPFAGMLGFVILVLCVVQIGPMVIVIPAVLWAWMTMSGLQAAAFALCLTPLPVIDNILKPVLMARGLSTPSLVILIGVIGGTLAHGLVGLFLGPIALAVFYELVSRWADLDGAADAEGNQTSVTKR